MKQSSFAPQNVVRTLTLAAGVLGVAFVGSAPPAQASGIPLPHEVIREVHEHAMSHLRHVSQVVDHVVGHQGNYRRNDNYGRYPGHVRYPGYYRPSYRYPAVVRGYRPYRSYYGGGYYGGGYYGGYVGVPQVGIVVGVRPGRDVYRDDDCDRNDDRYRNDYNDRNDYEDRNSYNDRNGYDDRSRYRDDDGRQYGDEDDD